MINDNFERLEKSDDLINISVSKIIAIANNIVLTDLSSKKESKLLVK